MESPDICARLPEVLLPWYEQNKRDLPWRADQEPYHVWLSEIMLQQTRVEAVKGYYKRFLEALPSIDALAHCDDDTLHKLWEGLGYYSRVRNLKKCAQVIMDIHHGQFPERYEEVIALPGIGEYTAGAICSICFSQPRPAVDGNVLRVIARITDDPTPIDLPAQKKAVTERLRKIYPPQAGDFTQSLMELGATVCGPNRKPSCGSCPCRDFCLGHLRGTAESLPVKLPKKKRREEDLTVFILSCDGRYALEQRPDTGLLASLWQFPNTQGKLTLPQVSQWLEQRNFKLRDIRKQLERKHIFTHIQWNMTGYYLEVSQYTEDFRWFTASEIREQAALPTAFRQFWEEAEDV